MAAFLSGLTALRKPRAGSALNRWMMFPLPSTMNVCSEDKGQRSDTLPQHNSRALAFLYFINVNLLWPKVGIQLLQWCPAMAPGWIPVEEWEGHSSLQVPGRFGFVLICFLSNDNDRGRFKPHLQWRPSFIGTNSQSEKSNAASYTCNFFFSTFVSNVYSTLTGSVSCYCWHC